MILPTLDFVHTSQFAAKSSYRWHILRCLKDNGNLKKFVIDPKELGINLVKKENLKGKNAKYNSEKTIEIYKGVSNEFSQAVALNVAAGLVVSGQENNFNFAFKSALNHLMSGKVYEHLLKIQSN